MTSRERVLVAIKGGKPDRVPVYPMVRHWCTRQMGVKFKEAILDPEKYVRAQIYCAEKFGYDTLREMAGMHSESEAMGAVLKFPEDDIPYVVDHPIKDYKKDLPRLRIPDPEKDGRLPAVLYTIRRLKELSAGRFALVCYIQAPFRNACMLRGTEDAMRDMFKRREYLKALLEITTEVAIIYGRAVARAGADVIIVSDPSSSGDAISPRSWEEFAAPYTARVVKVLKEETGLPIMMHICGDTSDRLASMAATGVDALSLDHKVDMKFAREVLGYSICLIGNVDPVKTICFGNPDDVIEEAKYVMDNAAVNGAFILSSGCGIPAEAPPENVAAMVEAAELYGRYC